MSNIYVQEPPCEGKVCLETTVGEIDIELWSKECPKACRNFVQLCLEGYYDKTKFFRVVPDFIVQGGDPTNTGSGLLLFWKCISYMFCMKVVKVSMVYLLKMSFTVD